MSGLLADAIEYGHAGWRWIMSGRLTQTSATTKAGVVPGTRGGEQGHRSRSTQPFVAEQFSVASTAERTPAPTQPTVPAVDARSEAAPVESGTLPTPTPGAAVTNEGCWYRKDRQHTVCMKPGCGRRLHCAHCGAHIEPR